ncbi:MAG: hypothetical protein CL887_05465, partial [Dehalococcoidia bacterium]|nr:hypothetical protein [Dehalococcoidia bacterium]
NFDKDAVAGFKKEHLANLDKEAVAGLGKEHLANFDKDAMAGFKKEHLANLDKEAVAGLEKEHLANINIEAVAGLGRSHIVKMSEKALSGFNVDQVKGLDSKSREGLGDKVEDFGEFSINVKKELVKNETRRMPGVGSFDILAKIIKETGGGTKNDNGWDEKVNVQEKFSSSLDAQKISNNLKETSQISSLLSKLNILKKK